jgi:DEAD/DEAH box helicase domain-containing protein
VSDLQESGRLARRNTDGGIRWTFDGEGSPQHEMSLRTIDDRTVDLMDRRNNDIIASLPFGDALTDAHPGAIYYHQGQRFEVVDLDLDRDVAELAPTWADYYTKTLHDKTIVVEEDLLEKELPARDDVTVRFADVTMTKQITGFERRDASRGEVLSQDDLSLPELTLRTKALYFTIPPTVERTIRSREGDFGGAIHAAEHGMISMFPLDLLCDRRDIGGLSTPLHPHTGMSTIFIYDGYPSGVGLSRAGYETIDRLMSRTKRMIQSCDCADGCPSCVQSPHCGNANEPLEKDLAASLLGLLLEAE